ncbi:MAG: ExeM/NucH family extracellular endonuclease [Acidimicrobiia bacterium]|nr:ExeM/NucH family extracellular endonuclease [Acidimicrobiia bacterium]
MTTSSGALRSRLVLIAVLAMLSAVLVALPAQTANAAVTMVAYDMVDTESLNLTDHTNAFAGAFVSSGDGFQKYQRDVSPSIPFGVMDDSFEEFPPDSQGIIKDYPVDHEFFGVVDTENDQNSGPVSATWTFDISEAAAPLSLSIDMGAMGDFEVGNDSDVADYFTWEYSIDDATPVVAFASTIDEAASHTYTLQGGAEFTLDDPAFVGTTMLTNDLQTLTTGLAGTGSELVLTLTAQGDGGSEAFAFQSIVVTSGEPDPDTVVINEIVVSTSGADVEYVEFYGTPELTLDGLSLVGYEADVESSGLGGIDTRIDFGPGDALGTNGFFLAGVSSVIVEYGVMPDLEIPDNTFENSSATYALVDTASLETEDLIVLDGVHLTDGDNDPSLLAEAPSVGPDGSFLPAGARRVEDGVDTDTSADWVISDFGVPGPNNTPTAGGGSDPEPTGMCGDPTTAIYTIQGSGDTSPHEGEVHSIEGVVIGDFQGPDALNGVFVQQADGSTDGDPATSEGIFVLNADVGADVAVGDVVHATGTVAEGNSLTQLVAVTTLIDCTADADFTGTASATTVTLPVSSVSDWESTEGMLVTINQQLYASGNFTQARFGEVDLSILGPLDNPTNVVDPGTDWEVLQDLNNRSRIQLDDGSSAQNPTPLPPYVGPGDTLRTGDTVEGLTGALSERNGTYEIHPTEDVSFTRVNERPLTPPDVGGDVTVAAFNVLNYFTTLDLGSDVCGPASDQGCRGADTADEFTRQRDKIVSAIGQMDAAVVGLMEIENHPGDVPTADLVAGINAAGFGPYDYIATGAVGIDAIRQAIIYQPGDVTPAGSYAVLDTSVDPTFNDDKNRAVVAQTFTDNGSGAVFTVAVNHLKSKGSACDDVGDPNADDGQGNCNGIRTAAAEAMATWLATDPTGSGSSDMLIIGDLNAYANEDPIVALENAGWTDLIEKFVGEGFEDGAYSFNFFSQSGYLDHGLASPSILPKVTGAAFWHINADEPSGLDYNNYNQAALYNPDPWRSSDHDPVLIGLYAAPPEGSGATEAAIAELESLFPTFDKKDDKRIGKAIKALEDSLDPEYWADDEYLTKKGKKVFDDHKKAVKELEKVDETDVDSVIDSLVAADRAFAEEALDIAIATGGKRSEITKALKEMAKAEKELMKGNPDKAIDRYKRAWERALKAIQDVRFSTFNASMNRFNAGDLVAELAAPGSAQPSVIAEIIQRARPDVLLVNEFDYDADGAAARLFQENYLSVGQGGADPIDYPFRFTAPSNTGVPSGYDLDNSGFVGGGNDAFGFGFFPGQYGMVVYSMFPIVEDDVRTFQNFLWKDMPGALLPDDPEFDGPADWYSAEELEIVRLSSKSHWDVPILAGDEVVHFLTSHPTPPVFDGPEDRNGTRNHDEIRFWADYVNGKNYIYDDEGGRGGLQGGAQFVIAGDQNSAPNDGDSVPGAIQQLLDHSKVNDKSTPSSLGAVEQNDLQGGINESHLSDPAYDTADFSDSAPGNLRADYVLPSKNLKILDSAVFWPLQDDPLFALVGTWPFPSSDHRLVWVDVKL